MSEHLNLECLLFSVAEVVWVVVLIIEFLRQVSLFVLDRFADRILNGLRSV